MSSARTHYQVMGLAETATPDDIKKAFRKLAREFHPDLHRDRPEMHEVFVRISQAYEILSDPGRRAAYDLDLRTQARRDTERRSGGFGSASYSQAAAGGSRAAAGGAATNTNSIRNEKSRQDKEKKRQAVNKVMDDARLAFARGHLTEARRLCQEVLEVSRMGEAYLMLGDIASRQGRWNAAVDNYTLAMQLLPNDPRIRRKFEEAAAQMNAGGRRTSGSRGPLGGQISAGNRLSYQLGMACFGAAVILFLMFWVPNLNTPKLDDWPFVEQWTVAHFTAMVIVGFLAGAVLSSATLVDTFHAQLMVPTVGPGKIHIPIGLILGSLGVIFFPLAVAAYALIARFQGGQSSSIVGMMTTAGLLVLGFWIAAAPAAQFSTLLMGGNVVFTASLFGWLVGDQIRPGWGAE